MSDDSSDSIPPELRVLLDLELTLEGLNSPIEQQKVEAALVDVDGIESVCFMENIVALRYDAEKTTKAELSELITAAGFPISHAASAPPTPSVE